jgi:hypothetical protein
MGASSAIVRRDNAASDPAAFTVLRAVWTLLRQAGGREALTPVRKLTGIDRRQLGSLRPAAVRVERSRIRGSSQKADHTAITMWFGSGPDLPSLLEHRPSRITVRTVAGALGVAALGALSVAAARREAGLLVQPGEDERTPALAAPRD